VCNSFSADTDVSTPNGDIDISEIQIGDTVYAYDELTGEVEEHVVVNTFTHDDDQIVYLTIDGEEIETTPWHPFYTDEGWEDAGDLQPGDLILSLDGDYGVVDSVVIADETQTMYDLDVETVDTFAVGDGAWVVHNTSVSCGRFNVSGTQVELEAYNYTLGTNPRWESDAAAQALQLRNEANQVCAAQVRAKRPPWEFGRVTLASPPNSNLRTVNLDAPTSASDPLSSLTGVSFLSDLRNLGQGRNPAVHAERQLLGRNPEYIVISNSRGMCSGGSNSCESVITDAPVFYIRQVR